MDISDLDGLETTSIQSKTLGLDGRSVIHPKHVGIVNSVFEYSDDEVERAKEIINVFEDAQSKNEGVAVVRGKLVEELHVRQARRTLSLSKTDNE